MSSIFDPSTFDPEAEAKDIIKPFGRSDSGTSPKKPQDDEAEERDSGENPASGEDPPNTSR